MKGVLLQPAFQFHKVRLKEIINRLFSIFYEFQFHKVRLKAGRCAAWWFCAGFQFHKVRLKENYRRI